MVSRRARNREEELQDYAELRYMGTGPQRGDCYARAGQVAMACEGSKAQFYLAIMID